MFRHVAAKTSSRDVASRSLSPHRSRFSWPDSESAKGGCQAPGTADVIAPLVDHLHQPRHNDDPYSNFNLFNIRDLARLARAPHFIKLDTDMRLRPGWISYVDECLSDRPEAVLFGTHAGTNRVDYDVSGPLVRRRLGADVAFSATEDVPARLREANDGRLADLVIVCTGALPALHQALESVERGGTVLFFAPTEPGVTLPVTINDVFFRNDVTLTTTYAGAPADLATAMDMIGSGRVQVGQMISHRLGLAEAGLGFKLTAEAGESLKVIIQPQK